MQKHEREMLHEVRKILPDGWSASLDTGHTGHPRLVLRSVSGEEKRLSYPRSPSDNRWLKNMLGFVREKFDPGRPAR